jgi:hypothetical protein
MWALEPNVTEVMRRAGREQVDAMLAEMACLEPKVLRDDLRAAGIDRAELFKSTNSRMAIRVHDTCTTFVTLALASGRSEAWIANRTGHTTSQMINEYLQQARTAAELELGQLVPLCEAIPELKRHRKGASTELKRHRKGASPISSPPSDGGNAWKVPAIPPTNGLVPADGFEPSLEDSKSSVLPLDDAGK